MSARSGDGGVARRRPRRPPGQTAWREVVWARPRHPCIARRRGYGPATRPVRRAILTISARVLAPSLPLMFATWTEAVFLLMKSSSAISPRIDRRRVAERLRAHAASDLGRRPPPVRRLIAPTSDWSKSTIAAASASSRDIPLPAVVARSRSEAVSAEDLAHAARRRGPDRSPKFDRASFRARSL